MSIPTFADFAALGITLPSQASGEVRTTCPQCSPSRRKSRDLCLSVNTETGLFHCHHCQYEGRAGGRQTSPGPRPPLAPPTPNEDHRAQLTHTWEAAHPLAPEDPAYRYLVQRGLVLPVNKIPPVLRAHPRLWYHYDDGRPVTFHPALVARIDDPQGQPINLHRTYLTPDGQKAAVPEVRKWMKPTIAGGTTRGTIRLYRPGETLALTEGIETALAVHLSTGLPVWAALCESVLRKVVVPPSVRLVVICADHDANGVGQAAAQQLAQRLVADGRRVKILLPPTVGTDWLDVYTDPQADPLTRAMVDAAPEVTTDTRPPTPDDDDQAAQVGALAHRLPAHLRDHPDPYVRQYWRRLYHTANALKQARAKEGLLL